MIRSVEESLARLDLRDVRAVLRAERNLGLRGGRRGPVPVKRAERPTARQMECHAFMLRVQREKGVPPSVREIAKEMGIASQNAVLGHLRRLVARGYVRHDEEGSSRGYVAIDVEPLACCRTCRRPIAPDEAREAADAQEA